MLNIVLFGPPGAGKGTQSEKLILGYNLTHLSTGDLFRKNISESTELGISAQKFMDDGYLVPDEIVIGMVEEKVKNTTDTEGFIFDGFPRTVAQAEALDNLMHENGSSIDMMLALSVARKRSCASNPLTSAVGPLLTAVIAFSPVNETWKSFHSSWKIAPLNCKRLPIH